MTCLVPAAGLSKVAIEDLPEDVRAVYEAMRVLPDGRVCGVRRLMFHWTLHVDVDAYGVEDFYCFEEQVTAHLALATWNGTGDPVGWHRHGRSGRRRDTATEREWIAR